MNHQHITIDGIDVPRDLDHLIATAKAGTLTVKESIEVGYLLEMYSRMAERCERAIHQMVKDAEGH